MIRKNYSSKRPGMGYSDREYVAIESTGHKTAMPVITICLDRGYPGGVISYGVNTNLCYRLSDEDRANIVNTIQKILDERR